MDGTNVADILSGGMGVRITPDAVKEIRVLTGGYPAEDGGAIGGIVSTELQTGGKNLNASLRMETDNFTQQGKSFLGGYSYGYSDYVATLSGPLVTNMVRFFVSAENEFYRDPGIVGGTTVTPIYWNGLSYTGLVTEPQFTMAYPNSMLSDTLNLNYPGGNHVGGQFNDYSYTGTLLFDLGSTRIQTAGSYSYTFSQDEAGIEDIFDTQKLPVNKYQNGFGNIRLTNYFSPQTFFDLNLNYWRSFEQSGLDPKLLTNFTNYGSPESGSLGEQWRNTSSEFTMVHFWSSRSGRDFDLPTGHVACHGSGNEFTNVHRNAIRLHDHNRQKHIEFRRGIYILDCSSLQYKLSYQYLFSDE